MSSRAVLVVSLLLLLLAFAPSVSSQGTSTSTVTAVGPPTIIGTVIALSPPIGLGFGPTSTSSLQDGVPVYALGDQIWVSSSSQAAQQLNLTDPSGELVARALVQPMGSVLLYTFSSVSPPGSWTLTSALVISPQGIWTTLLVLVRPVVAPAVLSGYELDGAGALALNFTVNNPVAEDVGACVAGESPPEIVSFQVPSNLGSGDLAVERNGSSVTVTSEGRVNTPFTFWVELHQDYSYALGNAGTTLVSRDVRAAESTALPILTSQLTSPNASSTLTTQLQQEVRLRAGRYTLRAFFEGSGGIYAAEAPVLLTNDSSWVSLQGCGTASGGSLSNYVVVSASLANPTEQWPREVFAMYTDEGVETFSSAPVGIQPAEVTISAWPWGRPLTNAHPTVLPNSDVQGLAIVNNAIYLTASSYPLQLSVSEAGPGSDVPATVTVTRPFSSTLLNVSAMKVTVTTLQGGKAVGGALVKLVYGNTTVATGSSGVTGESVLYVPSGNYSIVASYGTSLRNGTVSGRTGSSEDVSFDFTSPQDLTYYYLLTVTALLAIIASITVWSLVFRRRNWKPRFDTQPATEGKRTHYK